MTTKLEGDLRREIDIQGVPHVVTISPRGFVLTVKGRRKGLEIAWGDLVSGDAALATALNASLTANIGSAAAKALPSTRAAPAAKAGKKRTPAPANGKAPGKAALQRARSR